MKDIMVFSWEDITYKYANPCPCLPRFAIEKAGRTIRGASDSGRTLLACSVSSIRFLGSSIVVKTMRRSSTRKTGTPTSTSSLNSAADLFRSASNRASAKEIERIDHLFNSYIDKSCGMIDPEGIENLCSDMQVDHTDVRILMLAWKMQAAKQGYFTLDEWRRGLRSLRADTIAKLKKALPELEKEVSKPANFKDFYAYAFRYCLTEEKQKHIDIESICILLELVLGSQYRPQVDSIIEYLRYQKEYKVINMDQWMSILRFCDEINFPTLENYNPDYGWPLLLDNYVEWMRGNAC